MRRVRVRFAPSPTGPLHIGGLRTALYNYLFAKKHGGDFIIRIEDTDSTRFVSGAEEYINEALAWCGLDPSEGVLQGGPHAPYRQSERRDIYKKYADELVEKGWAYYAFDSAEELENLRNEYQNKGEVFAYDIKTRNSLKNSISLGLDKAKELIANKETFVIRFKTPENRLVEMNDLIRGKMQVETSTLDDKVLYKSVDELPTYHLANIVDDHLMEISHVIRGEEWLPSLPLHYLLYEAFGWKDTQPEFAHLPLLLKPQGQGKLSKRDGDKFGFPVFPLEWLDPKTGEKSMGYREEGYFPEALINILSLLGWNPGSEKEIFSLEELCEEFSLERVNKSGSRFNPDKAKWFNSQYIKAKSPKEIAENILPLLKQAYGLECPAQAEKIAAMFKDRVNFPHEIVSLSKVLYQAPTEYSEQGVKKFKTEENMENLKKVLDFYFEQWEAMAGCGSAVAGCAASGAGSEASSAAAGATSTNAAAAGSTAAHTEIWQTLEEKVFDYIRTNGYNMKQVMSLFRLLLIGDAQGPNVFPLCDFMGIEEVKKRCALC